MQFDQEQQHELFEEFAQDEPKNRRLLKDTSNSKRIKIHLSPDKIVIAAIVLLFFLVLAFSLGVERGKKIASNRIPPESTEAQNDEKMSSDQAAAPAEKTAALEVENTNMIIAQAESETEPAEKDASESGQNVSAAAQSAKYTVQVIAYTNQSRAERELEKLKKSGYEAFIISGNKYHIICIGRYPSRQEAKKACSKFDEMYKGCFVKELD